MKYQALCDGLSNIPLQKVARPWYTDIEAHEQSTEIENVKYVGSYNWIEDTAQPTILVPGAPPEWLNRKMPYLVPLDNDQPLVDHNASRMPTTPFIPLFCAADAVAEDIPELSIDWASVDIIADRSSLRKLLWWSSGRTKFHDEFRVDTQLVGKHTMLLSKATVQVPTYSHPSSYGQSFERVSTKYRKDCVGSTGSYRIIKYEFGGLNMIVRSEVDAYLPDSIVDSNNSFSLLDSPLATAPQPAVPQGESSQYHGLKIVKAGVHVPQSSLVELKTRALQAKRCTSNNNWMQTLIVDTYPQLFLSQVPNLLVAPHTSGQVSYVSFYNKDSCEMDMARKNTRKQRDLKSLAIALEKIWQIVKEAGREARLSFCLEEGTLYSYERLDRTSDIPAELTHRFETS